MPSLQARYDVIVVGAGLAGLFAGTLAARRGLRTLILARGLGGTHLGPGTIDVWGYVHKHTHKPTLADHPRQLLVGPRWRKQIPHHAEHPYTHAGEPALSAALAELKQISLEQNYPLSGDINHNLFLPTALGAVRPTCFAPASFLAGDLHTPGEVVIARLPGFRDFFGELAAANLTAAGYVARAVELPLPHLPAHRDAFATDLARLFDRAEYRAEVVAAWRETLKGVSRLGLPAILGLDHAVEAHEDLRAQLGIDLFEIPTLPPSVPGMRLFNALHAALRQAGGRLTVGPSVTGWVENDQALGVIAETASGPRHYAAQHIVLATGGFKHGGLEAPTPGHARETVFDLPVKTGEKWFNPLYWQAHPYARFGLSVNDKMQPVVPPKNKPRYANVFAIGGLLAGADRTTEGSREGIDLATAWKAVAQLPKPVPVAPKATVTESGEYDDW